MAERPLPDAELRRLYGPHPSYEPPGGWESQRELPIDRLVKTHCCFCGQQCGIQLKVRDNQVIGFEPWEEFPFNRGMLCPKGVKRYLQNGHPDRLLDPLLRTPEGFRKATWDEALDFTAAACGDPGEVRQGCRGGLRRRLAHHREVLSPRQVRARRAGHPPHRLQRPPVHGLGRHGLQAGLRRRPLAQPVERHPQGGGGCSSSAPTSASARPSPPTTSGAAATTAAG